MKWSLFPIFALSFLLSACGEDKPSDKLAADTVRKWADEHAAPGLEVADFVRENGWVDDQAPNRYKVRFNYNLKLVKPYAEVVLDNAKGLKREIEEKTKSSGKGLFDVNAMQSSVDALQRSMGVNQWIQNQGDNYKPRYEKFINNCAACIAYWNSEDAPGEKQRRREIFISSWMYYEELGFKDEAAKGSGTPRYAWSVFRKTEQGWLPVE